MMRYGTVHQDGVKGKVDFLTLGSPMGLHCMQRRLPGMNNRGTKSHPDLIRHWINFSAAGGVTAPSQNLNACIQPMLELGLAESVEDHYHGIYNCFHNDESLNCHCSCGYLVCPAVGNSIAG